MTWIIKWPMACRHHGDHGDGHTTGHVTRSIRTGTVDRVEGHGKAMVEIHDRKVIKALWLVNESNRFIEAMLRGSNYTSVAPTVARVCGICSVGHTLASLQATEAAFGIDISEQTRLLRKLAANAAILQSHTLHVVALVLPDLLGDDSIVPFMQKHPAEAGRVLGLKSLANDINLLIGGKITHPVALEVGGIRKAPDRCKLEKCRTDLENCIDDLDLLVGLVASLTLNHPYYKDGSEYEREREFISLHNPDEYPTFDGVLCSSDTGCSHVLGHRGVIREYMPPYGTGLYARHVRKSFMVGALARINNNFAMLSPAAKKVAEALGLSVPCHKPFMNTVAQLVECRQAIDAMVVIIDKLLAPGMLYDEGAPNVKPRAGCGVGAHEVPRGTLVHEYEYDKDGRIVHANLKVPTGFNHGSIQEDFKTFLPYLVDESDVRIRRFMGDTVRAYDPCISCSVHELDEDIIIKR